MSSPLQGNVLVVDDELRNIAIMRELLEDFTVEEARSGPEALEALQSFSPDVVLLDIMMPGMDGYEVCRKIRQQPEFEFVKVIFVSGKTMIEERLVGYEAGGDDYVTKPFDHDELVAKLRVHLKLKLAEERSAIKGEFLRLISSEAIDPLREIHELASLASTGKAKPGTSQQVITLSNSLLDFFDRSVLLCELQQRPTVHRETVEIADVVEAAVGRIADESRRLRIAVQDGVGGAVEGDSELLTRALLSLLDNTLATSSAGSNVEISLRADETGFYLLVSGSGDDGPCGPDVKCRLTASIRAVNQSIARIVARLHGGDLKSSELHLPLTTRALHTTN